MKLFDIYKQVEENPNLREEYGNQRLLVADSAQAGAMLHGLSELISSFEKISKTDPSYIKNGEPDYNLIFSAGDNLDRPNILFNPNFFISDIETYSRNYVRYVENGGAVDEKKLSIARNFIEKRESKEFITHQELVSSFVNMVKDMGQQWVGAENLSKVLFPTVNNPEPELYTAGLKYKGFLKTYEALIQNKSRATMKDVFDVLTNEANRIVEGNAKTIEYRYAYPRPDTLSYVKVDRDGNELSPFANIASGVSALIIEPSEGVRLSIVTDGTVEKKAKLFGKIEDVEEKNGKYFVGSQADKREIPESSLVYMVTGSTRFEAQNLDGDARPSDFKVSELLNNGTINENLNVGMEGDDLFVTFMNNPFDEPMANSFDAIKHRNVLAINHPKFKYGVDCFESERDSDRIYFKPTIGMIEGILGGEIGAFSQGAYISKEGGQLDSANVARNVADTELEGRTKRVSNKINPDFNNAEKLAIAPMISKFFDFDLSRPESAKSGRGFEVVPNKIKYVPDSVGTKHLNDIYSKNFDETLINRNGNIKVIDSVDNLYNSVAARGLFATDPDKAIEELGVTVKLNEQTRDRVIYYGMMRSIEVIATPLLRASINFKSLFLNAPDSNGDHVKLQESHKEFSRIMEGPAMANLDSLVKNIKEMKESVFGETIEPHYFDEFVRTVVDLKAVYDKATAIELTPSEANGLSEEEAKKLLNIKRGAEISKGFEGLKDEEGKSQSATTIMSNMRTTLMNFRKPFDKEIEAVVNEGSGEAAIDRDQVLSNFKAWIVKTINKFNMAEALGDPKEVENTLIGLKKMLKGKLIMTPVNAKSPMGYIESLFNHGDHNAENIGKIIGELSYYLRRANETLDNIKVNKILSINPKDEKMFESMDCSASSDSTLFLLGLKDKVEKTVQVLVGPAGTGKTVGLSKLENLGVHSLTTLNSPDALAAMQPDRSEVSVVDGEHMFNTPNYLQRAMRGDMIEGAGVFSFDETVEAVVKLLSDTPQHIAQGSLTNLLNKMRGSDIIFTHDLGGVNNDYKINGSMLIGNNAVGFDMLPSHLQQRFNIEVSAGTTDFSTPEGMASIMRNKSVAPAVKVINSAGSSANVIDAINKSDNAMKELISRANEGALSKEQVEAVFREFSAINKKLRNVGITDVCGMCMKETEKYEVGTSPKETNRYKNIATILLAFTGEIYEAQKNTNDAKRAEALKSALNALTYIGCHYEVEGKSGSTLRDFINTDLIKEIYETSIAKNVRVNPDFVPNEEYAKIAKNTMKILTSDAMVETRKNAIQGYLDRMATDSTFKNAVDRNIPQLSQKGITVRLNNLENDNEIFKNEMNYADKSLSKDYKVSNESYYLTGILSASVKNVAQGGQSIAVFEDTVSKAAKGIKTDLDKQIDAFAKGFAGFNSLVKDAMVGNRSKGELDFSSNKYPTITHRIAQNVVDFLKESPNAEINKAEFISNVIKVKMNEAPSVIQTELADLISSAVEGANEISKAASNKHKFAFGVIS